MKHYIIAKFKDGTDHRSFISDIREIFDKTLEIPGIHQVLVSPNCIDRPNRYDIMIEITMDKEALTLYDSSAPHHEWKDKYGDLLESKAIFDRED